jgi:integrase
VSGRWQARFRGPDGRLRSAPDTFARKSDAERYLTLVEAAMARQEWVDPRRSNVLLRDYTTRWIDERPKLRPRTVELYRWTFKRHIDPHLGGVPLNRLTTPMIRSWRAGLIEAGVSQGMAAKAYRLLRAVLWTAVREDELLTKNPCRIPGADVENPAERPYLTLVQVTRLSDLVPARYRVLIVLTAVASLRFGEVTALQRRDLDLEAATIRICRQFVEVRGKGLMLGLPKSRAGTRILAIPDAVADLLRDHLDQHVGSAPDALVFTTSTGRPIRRGTFNKLVGWKPAVAKLGIEGLHFHDLRHTGNMLAAGSRVSTRDLMARMGHDSMTAALVYQHASQYADRAVADHLSAELAGIRPQPESRGDRP